MGAYDFITSGTGKDAEQAFAAARAEACRGFGHRGYTGTIEGRLRPGGGQPTAPGRRRGVRGAF